VSFFALFDGLRTPSLFVRSLFHYYLFKKILQKIKYLIQIFSNSFPKEEKKLRRLKEELKNIKKKLVGIDSKNLELKNCKLKLQEKIKNIKKNIFQVIIFFKSFYIKMYIYYTTNFKKKRKIQKKKKNH